MNKKIISICVYAAFGIIGMILFVLFNNFGLLDYDLTEIKTFWECWNKIMPLAVCLILVQFIILACVIMFKRFHYVIITLFYIVIFLVCFIASAVINGTFNDMGFLETVASIFLCVMIFGMIVAFSAVISLINMCFSIIANKKVVLATIIFIVISFATIPVLLTMVLLHTILTGVISLLVSAVFVIGVLSMSFPDSMMLGIDVLVE